MMRSRYTRFSSGCRQSEEMHAFHNFEMQSWRVTYAHSIRCKHFQYFTLLLSVLPVTCLAPLLFGCVDPCVQHRPPATVVASIDQAARSLAKGPIP
jgi:hypothetical protein